MDWDTIRMALLRRGQPDWVPFLEPGVDRTHKQRVLGRPVLTLADDLEVSKTLGQPFVAISIGLQTMDMVLDAMDSTEVNAEVGGAATIGWVKGSKRHWAHGTVGAIRTEADFSAFPWPSPDDLDTSILDEAERLLPSGFKVILVVGKVFNLGWWLMGFDTYAYALSDQPALIERLHAKIGEIQGWVVDRALEYKCVGMVWHSDDMAYRTGLMVSPQVLRQHIFPVYSRLNKMCHERDVITVLHSDGKMDRLIDDAIAAGFDAFNPVEPVAMDIRALKKRVEGRLGLIGNVDLSYTLTRGTPEEVEAEVRGLLQDLAPGGGYALSSGNSIPWYVPWENFLAMHTAWLKYGRR
jgi:uroporphyrinogen decarboxylase